MVIARPIMILLFQIYSPPTPILAQQNPMSKHPKTMNLRCPTTSTNLPTTGDIMVTAMAYEANIKPVQVEAIPQS